MSGFIRQTFIELVLVLLRFGGLLAIKCVSTNNQQCMARQKFINLNLDQLHYCIFIIIMNKCDGNCNNVPDQFGRICASNKIEDVNLKVFNMIKKINE